MFALGSSNRCPLYARKQTSLTVIRMSALCQKRTHALQQITSAAIVGKRVYSLGGFKDWAGSGGDVEK